MEYQNNRPPHSPRRRKKSQFQIFKETYLPLVIAGAAIILILIMIVGSIVRSIEKDKAQAQAQKIAAQQKAEEEQRLANEAQSLLRQAAVYADSYDYDKAVQTLDQFSGDWNNYPEVRDQRIAYMQQRDNLVSWSDPAVIPNFSLQMLIADPDRAFVDKQYSKNFLRSFLTIEEFTRILEQLYENDYVLVSLEDIYETQTANNGTQIYTAKTLYLPEGKKPFILTQTNVNYHTYLVDGDGDKVADKQGKGFASKLVIDDCGNLANEYIDSQGNVLIGAYDMIPVLENFITGHPDFSYRGARAVIAVTGYDGLFGYRTNIEAETTLGTAAYTKEIENAKSIANKLTQEGYELACYTYENKAYGDMKLKQIEGDLSGWETEVTDILPNINIFVFAQNSDIGSEDSYYNDERFTYLSDAGFHIFLGFSANGTCWSVITDSYVRQGRILLTPSNIQYHSSWFSNYFTPGQILDPSRGTIPA